MQTDARSILSAAAPTTTTVGRPLLNRLFAPWPPKDRRRMSGAFWQEDAFLSAADLAEVKRTLWDLRDAWRTLNAAEGVHTLGYASYIDAATDATRPYYYQGSLATNVMLRSRMGWLYRRLADTLSDRLGAPVRYRVRCAVPGFHIFVGGDNRNDFAPPIHVDSQFNNLTWHKDEEADFSRTLSFTLSIELPRQGAGLKTWDEYPLSAVPCSTQEQFVSTYQRLSHKLHHYSEGALVVHSGKLVHQIAMGDRSSGNNRITLQGHAVWCDGAWQIYW